MTRTASPATTPVVGLCAVGAACVAVITFASPGATRMFAWPWTLVHAIALIAPAIALVLRAIDPRIPLALPPRAWLALAGLWSAAVLVSALASPYRPVSLLGSAPLLSAVAWFFLAFDGLQVNPAAAENRREQLQNVLLIGFALTATISVGLWLGRVADLGPMKALAGRNAFPLGHANYTAGLAVLILPLAVKEAIRRRGPWRLTAGATAGLALVMLFTSGSRGGLVGLAAISTAGLWTAPVSTRKKWQLTLLAALAGGAFILANPRMRASFTRGSEVELVAASDVQRSAMFTAGIRMGAERPLTGWGPGTTPLVYPRFRGGLAGGVDAVLQLHSTPIHVWAELGLAGVAALAGLALLVFRDWRHDPTAALTLFGYAAFALTDWQLDVPVFGWVIAILAARLAPICHPSSDKPRLAPRRALGGTALLVGAAIALGGQRDPAPRLNVRALDLARNPANAEQAITLLRESLSLNPDQEIAHFNLGWLLVVRDPSAAARHFRQAARLVPDKGGVYFGLGLAELNQGRSDAAARAFALECLNDPSFLSSPWWRETSIAATRDASAVWFAHYLTRVSRSSAGLHALHAEQLGRVPDGPGRSYRRTRTGYPVLMRNLDLPAPDDLFDVREADVPAGAPTVPSKGWLPSPLLLELLAQLDSSKP